MGGQQQVLDRAGDGANVLDIDDLRAARRVAGDGDDDRRAERLLDLGVGEAAPLLLLGVGTILFTPNGFLSGFTAMPVQIYGWTSESQEDYKVAAAAAIIVLMVMVLALNGLAIFIRNHFQRRW